jgi:hypothetical protein
MSTPQTNPTDHSWRPSPLMLPTRPGPVPLAGASPNLTPASASGHPPIRRFSTSSFSKLSDFHLDSPLEDLDLSAGISPVPTRQDSYSGGPSRQNSSLSLNGERSGVKGVRYVDLSLDAGEWRHPVFKQKVLAILRKLVSQPDKEGVVMLIPSESLFGMRPTSSRPTSTFKRCLEHSPTPCSSCRSTRLESPHPLA